MTGSESYGDSDDEALIHAATQADAGQIAQNFDASPRATKRRRVVGPSEDFFEVEDLCDNDAVYNDDEVEENNDPEARKRKHLLHAPRVVANLDRVILTQTQVVPTSQPWMIRGPIWKRPKEPEGKENAISNFVINDSGVRTSPTQTERTKRACQTSTERPSDGPRIKIINLA